MPPPEINDPDPMFTPADRVFLRTIRVSAAGLPSDYRRPGKQRLVVKDGRIQVERDGEVRPGEAFGG